MNDCPRFRTARRLATSLVVAALITTPVAASAAPGVQSKSSSMPSEHRKDFAAGKKAFTSGDYARAGDEWAAILNGLPETTKTQGTRMRLVLDTIASYREAYQVDGDVSHLQAGMDTYYAYFTAYKGAYGTPAIPRPVVTARHELKAELDEANDKANDDDDAAGAAAATVAAGDSDTDPSDNPDDSSSPTAQPADDPSAPTGGSDAGGSDAGTTVAISTGQPTADRNGTPLIAAGAVLMAVGVGASSLIAVGAIQGKRLRNDQKQPGFDDEQRARMDKQGRTMNAVLIAGVVATPVLVGAGIALVAVGAKKRKQSALRASVTPMFSRGVAGINVSGRF